jgi:Delta7-sterol 5-desaturase
MFETITRGLTLFGSSFLAQSLGYLGFVGMVFVVTRRWTPAWLARRRIQTRGRRLDRAQVVHELKYSLGVMALGTGQAIAVQALLPASATDLGGLGPLGVSAAFVGLIAFNDLWFYAVHRLLHTRWLFRHVHGVHHKSLDVNPFSSYSFHWFEAVLVTGWVVPMALWTPLPMPALMAAQVVGLLNNVGSHLGFELLPRWWVRAPLLGWTNTATFHALHHERFDGNFGLFSRVWDRLFGTEIADYEEAFEAAHATETSTHPR